MSEIHPVGFYVLVEMDEVKETTESGIVVSLDTKREQDACDIGVIKAIGPTAYRGFAGCNPDDYAPGHPFAKMQPHEIWGVNIGDRVEYRRFEGKQSGTEGSKRLRYIPDTQVIGKVESTQ